MIHIPNSIFSVPQCYKLQLQLQNTLKKYQFQVFVIFWFFFVWSDFLIWLQVCQMRGGGKWDQVLINIVWEKGKSWLRGVVDGEQRDEIHEQLGVTALQDLNECPCADRMVLFQACVAWLLYMWNFVVERKLMFLKISIDGVAVFVYNGPSGIVIHFIFN